MTVCVSENKDWTSPRTSRSAYCVFCEEVKLNSLRRRVTHAQWDFLAAPCRSFNYVIRLFSRIEVGETRLFGLYKRCQGPAGAVR